MFGDLVYILSSRSGKCIRFKVIFLIVLRQTPFDFDYDIEAKMTRQINLVVIDTDGTRLRSKKCGLIQAMGQIFAI